MCLVYFRERWNLRNNCSISINVSMLAIDILFPENPFVKHESSYAQFVSNTHKSQIACCCEPSQDHQRKTKMIEFMWHLRRRFHNNHFENGIMGRGHKNNKSLNEWFCYSDKVVSFFYLMGSPALLAAELRAHLLGFLLQFWLGNKWPVISPTHAITIGPWNSLREQKIA